MFGDSKIDKDKDVVSRVLMTIHNKYDRKAAVYGGYPRDLHFKKDYRDVDVYLRGPMDFDASELESLLSIILTPNYKLDDFKNTGSMTGLKGCGNIINVFECLIEGVLFNFIFTRIEVSPKLEFDFDICMFKFDPYIKEPVYVGPAKDFKNKIATFNTNISETQEQITKKNHLPKLKRKFPDFKFVYYKEL